MANHPIPSRQINSTFPSGDSRVQTQQFNQMMQQNQQLQRQLGAMGDKYGGQPDRPEFTSLLDPETGLMGEQYQLQDNLNRGALGQMREDALRAPGEQSQWRQLQEQNIQRQAGEAMARGQGQTSAAASNLAMRGGLRAGSAERLAQVGAQQGLQAGQNVLGQRVQLDIADEQQRAQGLQNLGGQELAAAQFGRQGDQFNIQTSLNENLQKRASDINVFNEQMRAWAAERTAAAAPSGGGGKK